MGERIVMEEKMTYHKQIRNRRTRAKVVRSMAKTTKGGKGRISKRPAYRKAMKR